MHISLVRDVREFIEKNFCGNEFVEKFFFTCLNQCFFLKNCVYRNKFVEWRLQRFGFGVSKLGCLSG